MESAFKKRHRIPASCLVCRKRKSKCDRVRPICGSCKRKSIAHLCYYEKEKGDPPGPEEGYTPFGDQSSYEPHHQPHQPPAAYQHYHDHLPHQSHHSQGTSTLPLPHGHMPQHFQYPPPPPHASHPHQAPIYIYGPPNGHSKSPHNAFVPLQSPMSGKDLPLHMYQGGPPPPSSNQPLPLHTNPILPVLQRPSRSQIPAFRSHPAVPLQTTPPMNGDRVQLAPLQNDKINYKNERQVPPASANFVAVSQSRHNSSSNPSGSSVTPVAASQERAFGNRKASNESAASNEAVSRISPLKDSNSPPISLLGMPPNQNPELVPIVIGPNSTLNVNPNDAMDVFTNASFSLVIDGPNWQQHGPISYTGLTKCDPFVKFFRFYAVNLFKTGELSTYLSTNKKRDILKKRGKSKKDRDGRSKPVGDDMTKGEELDDDDDEDEYIGIEDQLIVSKINLSSEEKAKKDAETNVKVKLPEGYNGIKTFNNIKNNLADFFEDVICKSALQVLPSQKSIFILFYRFFKYVYPFIPIVDESSFLMDINGIIPENFPRFKHVKYNLIKIKHPNELNTLAILLLVVRLGFMSMIHNDDVNNIYTDDEKVAADEMRLILSEEYGKVISLCIPDEQALLKSSFKLVQVLTLLHFYKLVAPEDCHGLSGSDAQLLLGVIIRHSITIGLNRDPKMYFAHIIRKKEPLMKCWRRLWHYIVTLDVSTAIHCGTILNIRSLDISDVEFPSIEGKTDELRMFYRSVDTISASYRNLSNKITNAVRKPRVVSILEDTNELEKTFFQLFGKDFFKDYICTPMGEEEDEEEDEEEEEDKAEASGGVPQVAHNTSAKRHSTDTLDGMAKKTKTDSSSNSSASNFGENKSSSATTTPPSHNSDAKPGSKRRRSSQAHVIASLKHEVSYIKVIKFITFIQLRTNLSCMYFMIALHYENKYNESKTPSMSAGIELFKIYIKSVVQLVYIMSCVLDHLVELFGKNYDYILTAVNEKCMIKTHSVLTSFFIRVLHHIKDLTVKRDKAQQSSEDLSEINLRLSTLHNLFLIILIESELFVGNFQKLSRKYINSYKLYVMLYLVLKQCMSDPDFFFETNTSNKALHHDGTNMLQFFTVNELEQVSRMCEEFRTTKEEQHKFYQAAAERKRARKPKKLGKLAHAHSSRPSMQRAPLQQAQPAAAVAGYQCAPPAQPINLTGGTLATEDARENSSLSTTSPPSSKDAMYSALNNFILGDNPMNQNEDFAKLFDVYNDFDQDSMGSYEF